MTLYSASSTWTSEEHHLFSDSVQKFYEQEMVPNINKWNDEGIVDRKFWLKAGNAGIMGGSVPEEYGGSSGDMGFDSIALYEQAKTGDFSWGYGIQSIVIHYVTAYGSHEQKAKPYKPEIPHAKPAPLASVQSAPAAKVDGAPSVKSQGSPAVQVLVAPLLLLTKSRVLLFL